MKKRLVIGADHNGFLLKEKIKIYLERRKINYEDVGAFGLDKNDDYPDYALKLARKVIRAGKFGLLFCGSATGMVIAANKINGIRAAAGINMDQVLLARKHNDVNVICLNGISYEGMSKKPKQANFKNAVKMITLFLNTKFDGGRHLRRLRKIKEIEKLY